MARGKDDPAQREIQEYRVATKRARDGRKKAAREVGDYIGGQVAELIVEGDVMGGQSMVLLRLGAISEAQRSGDQVALRAAVMGLASAAGAWVASIDMAAEPPELAVA
jgi:hypothetical protein